LLFLLGAALMFVPRQVQAAFGFRDLPQGVNYLIGLWGCVFLTLSAGYFTAARDPLRHVIWVQVGIARGALEFGLGVIYLQRGIVNWHQAAFGVIVAAVITIAYIILYPRRSAFRPNAPTPT
jgi:hypothetical protein